MRYTDPTGHKPCEEYAGTCLSENQVTQKWNNTQNGNHHDDDDEPVVTLTLTRDDLDGIQDLANQLSTQYAAQGQAWAWGVGTAATLGMLAVDGLSCGAAFGTAGVLTGGCVAALALNGVVIPSAANLAGAFGGNAAAQDFNDLSDVMNETLADNPQLTEFTVTIDLITETEILLPGGVGPTYTNYTVQITGMNSPVVLSGYAGGDVISMLFGVSP